MLPPMVLLFTQLVMVLFKKPDIKVATETMLKSDTTLNTKALISTSQNMEKGLSLALL